jgi:hypothetical protein
MKVKSSDNHPRETRRILLRPDEPMYDLKGNRLSQKDLSAIFYQPLGPGDTREMQVDRHMLRLEREIVDWPEHKKASLVHAFVVWARWSMGSLTQSQKVKLRALTEAVSGRVPVELLNS